MGIDFNNVFAGIGVGGLHVREQHFIDHITGGGIQEAPQVKVMAIKTLNGFFGSKGFFSDFTGQGATDANNTDPGLAWGCGNRGYGIVVS